MALSLVCSYFLGWTRKIYFWVDMKWATLGQWGWMGIGWVEDMGVEGNFGGRRRFGGGREFGRWKGM